MQKMYAETKDLLEFKHVRTDEDGLDILLAELNAAGVNKVQQGLQGGLGDPLQHNLRHSRLVSTV